MEKLAELPAREAIGRLKSAPVSVFDEEMKKVLDALDKEISETLSGEESTGKGE